MNFVHKHFLIDDILLSCGEDIRDKIVMWKNVKCDVKT